MKYNEDKILEEVLQYIKGTYSEHYAKDGFQLQDAFKNIGVDKAFDRASAIKYLFRYGKKFGNNKKDLYKAIHYIVMLLNSDEGT